MNSVRKRQKHKYYYSHIDLIFFSMCNLNLVQKTIGIIETYLAKTHVF
jgi:hypothetical protein